jgi:transposase
LNKKVYYCPLTDKELISQLQAQLAIQAQQIKLLEEKVLLLLSQIQSQSVKKDSHNSSLPPSSDIVSKTKNLRVTSERKSGGQFGHKGTTLEMSATPDKIIDLKSAFCSTCGQSLQEAIFTLKASRQVVEIPPIKPIYEEYRQYTCQCPRCQNLQISDFPAGVNAPIQYGSSVESLVSYFSVYQYIPFKRLKNLFSQAFSMPISEGSIGNILERSAQKCKGVYQIIKQQIAKSSVVGADETGAKVNGKKWWLWVWQNVLNTFIVASDNRGSQTINSVWRDGLPNATLVSDRWAAQLKSTVKNHQLCLAHLLRELIFLEESEQQPFAKSFKELIVSIFDTRKTLIQAYLPNSIEALAFENTLNQLLLITIDKEICPQTVIFQASMIKYRNYLLPCLYNLDIPPDNNGSERAIRNVKIKQKVSGQFKSGQSAFCTIRSVIDTLLKRNLEVLPYLTQIIKLRPES